MMIPRRKWIIAGTTTSELIVVNALFYYVFKKTSYQHQSLKVQNTVEC